MIRGVTLDGAADGLKFYLKPDINKLGDAQVGYINIQITPICHVCMCKLKKETNDNY